MAALVRLAEQLRALLRDAVAEVLRDGASIPHACLAADLDPTELAVLVRRRAALTRQAGDVMPEEMVAEVVRLVDGIG